MFGVLSKKEKELKQFFSKHDLMDLFPSFLNAEYTLDLLEVCEESDIRQLCKELNVSLKQRLKLIKAIRNLQNNNNIYVFI